MNNGPIKTHVLTGIALLAYSFPVPAKSGTGISLLQYHKVQKHLHSKSAFFIVCYERLWWAVREHFRVRRILVSGKANPVQSITIRLASFGDGLNQSLSQGDSHV